MAAAIVGIADDPLAREVGISRASKVVHELAWEREAERYLELVEGTIARR
jgi:glycosyltransferase involved in cell wall biosynthesis